MEDFQHKLALKELGIPTKKYPKEIISEINTFDILKRRYFDNNTQQYKPGKLQELQIRSAKIADDMQTFIENDLPEGEPEKTTKTQNKMELTPEQLERAKAVGLSETATVEQIEAAEIKAHTEKTKAEAAAAEAAEFEAKKAKDEAEATRAAEEEKQEKAKAKVVAEEDIFDELGI